MASPPPRPTLPKLDQLDLVITTSRLRLRPFADGDVDDLWPHVSNPEVSRLLSWHPHTDRGQTLAFIQAVRGLPAAGTGVVWAIEHAGRAAGCIALESIQFELRAWRLDRAMLGYWIAPPLWGQGLMTEAGAAVMRFGFEQVGLHKIVVSHIVENAALARVIAKLAFRPAGRAEDEVWRDGRWWSVASYELTAGEWSDVSTTLRISRPRLP